MNPSDPVADSLLVHASFVRRLARALAGPEGEDLAQDTWTAALQSDPRDMQCARGWLATIARNLARNLARGEARRRRRHADAAREPTSLPSVAEIVAREEARRRVVDAVLALPESLRSVVLLRFFEGLDSRAIGQRLGMASSTVRTQLQRALTMLRSRLDREHGQPGLAWGLPLIPIGGRAPTLAVLLRVCWQARVAMAIAVLALIGWLVVPPLAPPPGPFPVPPVEAASREHRGEDETPRGIAATDQRTAVADVASPAAGHGPEDLWGRVVDADNDAPIAGAEVVLEHRDADEMTSLDLEYGKRSERIGTATTTADGGFAFHVQRALQHRIAVLADGYAPYRERMCTGGSEFVLRLERPASIEGVVRDPKGQCLADVLVTLVESGAAENAASVRTTADGRFSCRGLRPRPTWVAVRAPGWLSPDQSLVELVPGQVAQVDITFGRGRTARGVVTDAETKLPIRGARVAGDWTMADAAVTDDDGRYVLRGLTLEDSLFVRADGYAEQTGAVASQAESPVLDFALLRGDIIVGRIVDGAGRGLGSGYVAAASEQWQRSGAHTSWVTGAVDVDGHFRIERLPRVPRGDRLVPPAWQLLVRAPGMGSRVFAMPYRRFVDGVLDLGDLRLAPQAMLEGRVVDGAGQPIAHAEVVLQGTPQDFLSFTPAATPLQPLYHFWTRTTHTAGDGSYRIGGIAAGNYTLHARPSGVSWNVESGPHEIQDGALVTLPDLVADSGLSITGIVRGPGGRPLPTGGDIELAAHGAMSETRTARVQPDGSFRIERLEPGEFTLAALDVPPGFALVPRAGVVAGSRDVVFELMASTTIEGRVVDSEDKPVRGASVCFFTPGVSVARMVSTDDGGRFRIETAPGLIGRLSAQHPERMVLQAQRDDVAAGTVDIVLKLTR